LPRPGAVFQHARGKPRQIMSNKVRNTGGLVGVLFLGVGILKLAQGDDWIVWFLLAFLFGGFAAVAQWLRGKDAR
jgi:hypothetical protein